MNYQSSPQKSKTKRIAELAEKIKERANGNRARHLVNNLAESYKSNPEELRKYFSNNTPLISGLATAVYGMLTGDLTPVQSREYGGFGITLNSSRENLSFSRNQLWFAKLSGDALLNSENSGNDLWRSKNSDYALLGSENSGKALWGSKRSLFNRIFVGIKREEE